jgi:hypothetical protein
MGHIGKHERTVQIPNPYEITAPDPDETPKPVEQPQQPTPVRKPEEVPAGR